MQRKSLRIKLTIATIGLVAFAMAMAAAAVIALIRREAMRDVEVDLANGLGAAQRTHELITELLANKAIAFSELPLLKATLAIPDVDRETALEAARAVAGAGVADVVVLLDQSGHWLCSHPTIVPRAELGQQPIELLRDRGRTLLVAWSEISTGQAVIGQLGLGRLIGQRHAHELELATGHRVDLWHGSERLAGSEGPELSPTQREALRTHVTTVGALKAPMTCGEGDVDRVVAAPLGGGELWVTLRSSHQRAMETAARAAWATGLIALAAALLAAIVAARIAARITKPLTALEARALELATSDAPVALPPSDTREIHALSQAFGTMSQRIRQALDAAESARDEAERAAASRGQFISNMSHELRTPLNGIVGSLELLANEHPQSDREALIRVLRRSAGQLRDMVEDVLDYSTMGTGSVELRPHPTDLRSLIDATLSRTTARAREQGLELSLCFGSDVPTVIAVDPERLGRAIHHLVDNAIKYTGAGFVQIRVQRGDPDHAADLLIAVEDSGIGIAPEDHDRAFGVLTQIDESHRRRAGGVGLGLALVRRIAEAMGGSVALHSALGVGSVFTLRLPLLGAAQTVMTASPATKLARLEVACPRLRAAAAEDLARRGFRLSPDPAPLHIADHRAAVDRGVATQSDVDAIPHALWVRQGQGRATPLTPPWSWTEFELATQDRPASAGAARPGQADFDGLRVLAVDDNQVNLKVLRLLLTRLGCKVTTAEDGAAAVRVAAIEPFDLILMDIQMPVLDGYAATQAIRALPGIAKMPILAVSAGLSAADRELCLAAGMDDYLPKPIDPPRLIACITSHLRAARPLA